MDAAINRFIFLLKRSGVGISPAESMDAVRALMHVSLAERELVRCALRATLIKDHRDEAVFDEQFELFFGLPAPSSPPADAPEIPFEAQPLAAEKLVLDPEDEDIPVGNGETTPQERMKIQPGSLAELGQNLILKRAQSLLDPVMQRATHQINARRAGSSSRPGDLNFSDIRDTLDADLIAGAVERLLADLKDLDLDEALLDALAQQAPAIVEALPETLKRFLEAELARKADRERVAEPRRRRAVEHGFTEAERSEMAEMVRRLGRRMRGARSYRRVLTRKGRIHVARTLRNSMVYDGIPFHPVTTSLRREKPRIVVICDVSLSVRNAARFTLHLVYSMQALFDQVRSFVFVSDLAEASQFFERSTIEEAIAAIFDGELIDCDANSNYGRALEIFYERHLSVVTGETTVIILGDGRGNRNPPNVWVLEEIRRRCRQLVWLSPEPRGSWGLGSSDMPLYEPICHRAEVVRNLDQLGQVADELVRGYTAGPHGH
ncbi:MAG: VWA domain-containing protein [Rhodospirillales bacterium]|nr:VWA domain-containing protein [Rhodospirillales bacterium]